MLRARLATNLVFNLCIALWVLHDARARRARKPLFAAMLALMWGPLGLGFWLSDRPLLPGEQRAGGTAWTIAFGFLAAWLALAPAVFLLAVPFVEDRLAVPGSLGQRYGVIGAALIVTSAFWSGPALLALALGRISRTGAIERGPGGTPQVTISPYIAAAGAGLAAVFTALLLR